MSNFLQWPIAVYFKTCFYITFGMCIVDINESTGSDCQSDQIYQLCLFIIPMSVSVVRYPASRLDCHLQYLDFNCLSCTLNEILEYFCWSWMSGSSLQYIYNYLGCNLQVITLKITFKISFRTGILLNSFTLVSSWI